jgi:hypothetical protein
VRLCRSLLVAALELSLLPSEGVLDLFVTRFCLPHVAGPGRAGADAGCGGGGGGKDALFVELWKACAGPLSSVPLLGEKVYYFPQGHIEQVRQQLKRRVALLFPLMLPLHPRVFRRGFGIPDTRVRTRRNLRPDFAWSQRIPGFGRGLSNPSATGSRIPNPRRPQLGVRGSGSCEAPAPLRGIVDSDGNCLAAFAGFVRMSAAVLQPALGFCFF